MSEAGDELMSGYSSDETDDMPGLESMSSSDEVSSLAFNTPVYRHPTVLRVRDTPHVSKVFG